MRFTSGQFLGQCAARRTVGALALAELRPTVPEHEVHRHQHDDAHLLLLIEGRYLSSARGMPALCAHPVVLLNPPGTEHRDCFRGLDGRFLTLSLSNTAWQDATATLAISDAAVRLPVQALAPALRLLGELRQWDAASPLAVEDAFARLLAEATRIPQARAIDAPAWLLRAEQRLADAHDVPPSLAELATLADVHPVHFARLFRRRHGVSPADFLRARQLESALARIASGVALADAANDAGYVDQSHLHRWCRRLLGMTPGALRALLSPADVARVQERGGRPG
jgi:AraC family transcriptional regulator